MIILTVVNSTTSARDAVDGKYEKSRKGRIVESHEVLCFIVKEGISALEARQYIITRCGTWKAVENITPSPTEWQKSAIKSGREPEVPSSVEGGGAAEGAI